MLIIEGRGDGGLTYLVIPIIIALFSLHFLEFLLAYQNIRK